MGIDNPERDSRRNPGRYLDNKARVSVLLSRAIAECDCSMAECAGRWGITANAVRRMCDPDDSHGVQGAIVLDGGKVAARFLQLMAEEIGMRVEDHRPDAHGSDHASRLPGLMQATASVPQAMAAALADDGVIDKRESADIRERIVDAKAVLAGLEAQLATEHAH